MNGDFMVATSLSTITKGHHMIDILNCLEVDFVVPGIYSKYEKITLFFFKIK